jgi:hypothetical protein
MGRAGRPLRAPLAPTPTLPREGREKESQNAGTSDPLNCVSMKLFTSGDW